MKRRNKSAFDRCVESVAARGSAADPRAVCATAGVRKYGQAEMTRRAIAGKKRAARRRGNPTVAEHKADFYRQGFAAGKKESGQEQPVLGPGRASGQGEFMAQRLVDYYGLPQSKAGAVAAEFTRGYFDGFHGKRRGGRRNAPRVTQREVDSAAGTYHNMLMRYGENNMATQRAEFKYRDLQRAYADQKAKRAARGNPLRYYARPGVTSVGGGERIEGWDIFDREDGQVVRHVKTKSAAMQVLASLNGRAGGSSWVPSHLRGNPAEAARAVSEEFHGRKVREMVPVTERRHYHKFLAELGELTLLVIHTPDGRHKVELTQFAGAMLTTNEKKNQLFITGGDQSVNLRDFGIRDPHEKEHLGELRKIAYYTDKEHLGDEGGEADYHHSFSKPYPHVDFYTRDTHLEIFGGRYKITREGIVG